jgi:hypothetical protein
LPDGRQQIVGLQFASDFVGPAFKGKATCNAEAASQNQPDYRELPFDSAHSTAWEP